MQGAALERAESAAAELVVVGRVGATHGVRGWLRVASFTAPQQNILEYRPWSLQRRGVWRPVQVQAVRRQGGHLLCRFDGVADRDAAATLRGALIGVPEAALPSLDANEYYWRHLIGLDVVTTRDERLGRVENLVETGANDALVVRDGECERLLPFVAHVAREVDLQRRIIVVDWDPNF